MSYLPIGRSTKDLTGRVFGRLTVTSEQSISSSSGNKRRRCLCSCVCGGSKWVDKSHLNAGSIQSCGCIQKEGRPIHGLYGTKVYRAWIGMVQRTTNPNSNSYERYMGRGICISPDWLKFEAFFFDMGHPPEGYSLDRIDNDGNYCKENCRWASLETQSQNRKRKAKNQPGISKHYHKWKATIDANHRRIYLGLFETYDEAVAARLAAEEKHWAKP